MLNLKILHYSLIFLILFCKIILTQVNRDFEKFIFESSANVSEKDLYNVNIYVSEAVEKAKNINLNKMIKKPTLYFCKNFAEFNSLTNKNNKYFAEIRNDKIVFQSINSLKLLGRLRETIIHELIHYFFISEDCMIPEVINEIYSIGLSESYRYYPKTNLNNNNYRLKYLFYDINKKLNQTENYYLYGRFYLFIKKYSQNMPDFTIFCKLDNIYDFLESLFSLKINLIEKKWKNFLVKEKK